MSGRPVVGCVIATWAAIVLLAVPGTVGAAADADPQRGGHAVVGLDAEPLCLNVVLSCGNLASTQWTAGVALAGAFRITPDYGYEPVLVDDVTVSEAPFSLTYHIKAEAVWSDGTPVTADDFIFTLDTIMNPAYDVLTRTGYDAIVDAVRLDDKTVRFEFASPYAPWRELFSTILPRHALDGEDFNQAFQTDVDNPKTGKPIGSGPYLVARWATGRSIKLTSNPRWWGDVGTPYLSAVEFTFMPTPELIPALLAGRVEAVVPQPSPQLASLLNEPGIVVDVTESRNLEHLDFRVDSPTQPLLANRWFRQAVAYALDRDAVAEAVWGVFAPGTQAAQSLFYTPQQAEYVPDFAGYFYSPAMVATIMSDNGCVKGLDGIWICDGTRASIEFATTSGNQIRELAQNMLKTQAEAAGIELVHDNSPAPVFSQRIFSGDFEASMFTWVKGGDVGGGASLYGCNGDLNVMDYCSPEVDALLIAADAEVDPVARAALVNQADALLAEDVPSLPLFNRRAFLAYSERLQGALNNPSPQGPTWNIEDWWVRRGKAP